MYSFNFCDFLAELSFLSESTTNLSSNDYMETKSVVLLEKKLISRCNETFLILKLFLFRSTFQNAEVCMPCPLCRLR